MIELLPHQEKPLKFLDNGKILYGGTGSGKTLVALWYYTKKESPKDIYVITTPRKRDDLDWQGDAVSLGIGMSRGNSLHGVINVDSWNNIGKYVDVEDAFFIFDEQRLVGTGAWVKAFLKIAKKNRWIMLSATPGDVWLDYAPVFIANGLYKNITEFKREHVVYAPFSKFPKIMRYTNVALLEKYRNMILVEMPYIRHTNRIVTEVPVFYDEDMFQLVNKKRWNPYTDEPLKDVSELFRVMRRIANSDPSRLEAVRSLFEKQPKQIIFYNFDYELEILRKLHSDVETREWNGHVKQKVPTGDSWAYLVQYVAGAEAWNCITTDTTTFYSLTYSYKNFHQAQGRIDRLNTPFVDLFYYVLMSKMPLDMAIRASLNNKKSFQELKFADQIMALK